MKIGIVNIRKACIIIFIMLMLLFAFWKVHLGVHSDEAYLIAIGDMIAGGNSFFKECWSSLQMSAVFTAPFIFIYGKITGGREGILLFFRILSVCIQSGICIYFYNVFRQRYQKKYVLIASILLFTFIPDFQSFTYKQELIWFVTLEIIYSYQYSLTCKRRYLVLLGIMIACSVLAYPTAILQFPLYLCLIYLMNKKKHQSKQGLRDCVVIAATCFASAVTFLMIVLGKISVAEFIEFFPKVFSDNNLEMSFLSKLIHPFVKFGAMGFVTVFLILLYEKISKIRIPMMTCLLWAAFAGQVFIERRSVTWHCITYPYTLTLFMVLLIYLRNQKNEKDSVLIGLFVLPTILTVLCLALASNQGNVTSMYGTVFSAAALLLMIGDNENTNRGGTTRSILLQGVYAYLL